MEETNTALEVVPATTQAVQTVPAATNIELTSTLPHEMEQCQVQLIDWCKRKIAELQHDLEDLNGAYEHAKKQKWKTVTLKNHSLKCSKRILYYEKVLAALEAGFVIVPNFPVTVFAVRTSKGLPKYIEVKTPGWHPDRKSSMSTPADKLPIGEGEYKNPIPEVSSSHDSVAEKTTWYPVDWQEMDFPINMAKPRIMEAATNAMALKIFDDLGVLPSPYKREDPMVIARILNPFGSPVSFLVAWHLNTRDL